VKRYGRQDRPEPTLDEALESLLRACGGDVGLVVDQLTKHLMRNDRSLTYSTAYRRVLDGNESLKRAYVQRG
jgi:hypothetical protein